MMKNIGGNWFRVVAVALLVYMAVLASGAALRESTTVDEVAHIGASVSYVERLDMRLNEEHPPLPKVLAGLSLVLRGTKADYSHISWTASEEFFPAYAGQWIWGEWLMTKWNEPASVLAWARAPMLLVTLALGLVLYAYARKLGGAWAGLLCLSVFVGMPAFIAFGPLVHTDMAVTLFSLVTLWRFAELWKNPAEQKNVLLFGLSLAGALLSKFTAGILFFVFLAAALSLRWRPLPGQPNEKEEAKAWRRVRRRALWKGIFWAALAVYVFYFFFSIHQPTSALDRIGHTAAAEPVRRLLMPAWLYLRGVFMVVITASRPTFILGHSYPHGVWFYFPIVFALKTPLGLLGLLTLSLIVALVFKRKRSDAANGGVIDEELRIHWRVLWVALVVFTGFCLLSRLDISIRHFSIPLVLLILLLAPLPVMVERLRASSVNAGRWICATAGVLALSCLITVARAYPFYFPYLNGLNFGRPAYVLVNDSNVDWNQSLPEVKKFAEEHRLEKIEFDSYGLNDATTIVPQSKLWDCQKPTTEDEGKWVAMSANMIMDGHNCIWLMQYPHQALAGGSVYAVQMPEHIPEPGSAGGPPLESNRREFGGAAFDMRVFFLGLIRDPGRLPQAFKEMQARFEEDAKAKKQTPSK